MKNAITLLITLIAILICFGCSEVRRSNNHNAYRYVSGFNEVSHCITIKPDSGVTPAMLDAILQVRGWDDGDIWEVDKLHGDIRITKSRNNGMVHIQPVEFWRLDLIKKTWYALYTA